MSQFRLYTDVEGAFRWKLQATDKSTVARSAKGYKTEAECRASLAAVRKDAGSASIDGKIRTVAAASGKPRTRSGSPSTPVGDQPRAAEGETSRRTSPAK
jgi:uncharacterized protein YegP (UPF0339 family)